MLVGEFSEWWQHGGHEFQGMLTELDQKVPGGEPGRVTRVSRLLVEDAEAENLSEGALIKRVKTEQSYEVKTKEMSGMGLTELDLARSDGRKFERRF